MTTKIIDADSHILEPPDLGLQYLEPELQERAMRIKTDSQGLEYLEVDGKPASGVRGGMLANIAGAGRTDLEHFLTPGAVPYEEARADAPASGDPDARVKWLDSEGSDMTLLYPSLGLDWPQDCRDPILSAAYTRAYNNWLIDFCSGYPDLPPPGRPCFPVGRGGRRKGACQDRGQGHEGAHTRPSYRLTAFPTANRTMTVSGAPPKTWAYP